MEGPHQIDAAVSNVLMAILALCGTWVYFLGWPCGEKDKEHLFGVFMAAFIVAASSAWISTGERQKTCFRIAFIIQAIATAWMIYTWCFGQRTQLLFMAHVFCTQSCMLKIAAPDIMIWQLGCVCLCLAAWCLSSRAEEQSSRRLRDSDDEDDWGCNFIVFLSFFLVGVVGLAIFPARAACRRCCRCRHTPRIGVAEDLATGDSGGDASNRSAEGESGVQDDTIGLHSIVPGASPVEEAGHEGTQSIDDVASAGGADVEEHFWYTESTECLEQQSVDSSIAAVSVFGCPVNPTTVD